MGWTARAHNIDWGFRHDTANRNDQTLLLVTLPHFSWSNIGQTLASLPTRVPHLFCLRIPQIISNPSSFYGNLPPIHRWNLWRTSWLARAKVEFNFNTAQEAVSALLRNEMELWSEAQWVHQIMPASFCWSASNGDIHFFRCQLLHFAALHLLHLFQDLLLCLPQSFLYLRNTHHFFGGLKSI